MRVAAVLFLPASAGMLLSSGMILAQPGSPDTGAPPIVAVQMFANQAMIRRSAQMNLKPGVNELVIDGLPGTVIDDSVRVAVDSENVKLEEVRIETEHRRIYRSEEAKEAEQLLRKAESRLRTLSDSYTSRKEEEATLLTIQAGPDPGPDPTGSHRRSLDPDRWQALLDFQRQALERNHDETEKILEEIDGAREEVAIALTVAERYRSETTLSQKKLTVSVNLQGKNQEKHDFSVEYRIAGAAWFPIYSARVLTSANSDRAKVRLAAYALVKNETGEDWRRIRLGFSAADPDESARLPALTEWHIKPVLIDTGKTTPGGQAEEKERRLRRSEGPATEAPAVQQTADMDRMQRPDSKVAREENAPVRPAPSPAKKKKEDLAKQQLDEQTVRTRDYFAKNNETVKDERARQKTEKVQAVLGEFQSNIQARDTAVRQGNFNEALSRSEMVLDNIRNLDERYRRFFKEEEERSLQIKRQSLDMLDAGRFTSRLISPLQAARGFDYRYETTQPETVRSDGAFRKIFLFEKELDAGLLYESVPGRKLLAFLVGEIKYKEAVPLLAGPVSVFHNTDYVGESSLASVSSGVPFRLHLGADEQIKVERTERSFRETQGLLSRSYVYRYEVTLTVKNRRRTPTTLVLFDRIPVPTDERVKITDVQIDPAPSTDKNDYGLLGFTLQLKAGEEKKVRIQYRLSHPADVLPVFREPGSPGM